MAHINTSPPACLAAFQKKQKEVKCNKIFVYPVISIGLFFTVAFSHFYFMAFFRAAQV
jgi:hypothetical protein